MTYEDKARELANLLNEDFLGIDMEDGGPMLYRLDATKVIAEALRDAHASGRLSGLEEAAKVATASLAYYPDDLPEEACARIACRDIAAHIRALGTQDKGA